MASFDGKFIQEAMVGFVASVVDAAKHQKAELRFEGEFGRFSLRDAVRLVGMVQSDATSEQATDLRDKVARQLLNKVDVKFFLDGQHVGTLTKITDPGQSLEADEFLQNNPLFYQIILDVTTGYILKNFTAPPKVVVPPVGADRAEQP